MTAPSVDPLLLNFPESFESERLLIRAPLWGDGKAVNEAVAESFEQLRQWMPWAQHIPTLEESELHIRQSRISFLGRKDLGLLLIHKETGQLAGMSGLHRINWDSRSFEIGYWVRASFAGQGYITEAVHAITDFAVREFQANRVEIRCDSRNERSAEVARRAGFVLEGILRKDSCAVDGSPRDTMVFSKVRGVEF